MRNYFKTLQLNTTASRKLFARALRSDAATAKALAPRTRADAHDILLDDERRQCYSEVVELYEAMHAAMHCLREPVGIDTHRWKARLSEFEIPKDDYSDILTEPQQETEPARD